MSSWLWQHIPNVIKVYGGLLITVIVLTIVDVGLKTVGYRRTCQLLLRVSPQPQTTHPDFRRATAVRRVVDRVSEPPLINSSCLRRSLTLWWLLRWLNVSTQIRLGVNRDTGHAWVEHYGQVINDIPDISTHYLVVYSNELTPEVVGKR
jgi:hypothetical protein